EARFHSFVERLRQRNIALALLKEYPVLARQLVVCVQRWADVSIEFLYHLAADHASLRQEFSPQADPGPLVEIHGEAGDTHRGGRPVLMAQFQPGLRVVSKPRSLLVDRHFQELLDWVTRRGEQPPFRTLALVERGDHGWIEFVEAGPC